MLDPRRFEEQIDGQLKRKHFVQCTPVQVNADSVLAMDQVQLEISGAEQHFIRIGNERRTGSIAVANQKIARLWDLLRADQQVQVGELSERKVGIDEEREGGALEGNDWNLCLVECLQDSPPLIDQGQIPVGGEEQSLPQLSTNFVWNQIAAIPC